MVRSGYEGAVDRPRRHQIGVRQFSRSIGDNRVIFDIGGNKYRLIVKVSYTYKACQIKFIGTHSEYDYIDPLIVEVR